MQERFNRGRYMERLQHGEFRVGIIEDCGPPPDGCPRGTRSQSVSILDQRGYTVAWVHEKAGLPNGEPAEGTWADPKFLYEGGVRYVYDPMLDLLEPPQESDTRPAVG
jgi:hypothetical protein